MYSRRTLEYRQQDALGASPIHAVVMTYDVAIQACYQKDLARVTQALGVLRDALNFDYPDVATGFFKLYQWCADCVRQGDYDQALKVLVSLRSAWADVDKRLSSVPVTIDAPEALVAQP
jgi:flagellin-specific chaperone FliS